MLDKAGDLGFEIGNLGAKQIVFVAGEARVERFELVEEFLVAPRLAGLTLEGNDLALDLFDDVGDADEVGFGILEFAESFLLLELVLVDAGGFFEDGAAVFCESETSSW